MTTQRRTSRRHVFLNLFVSLLLLPVDSTQHVQELSEEDYNRDANRYSALVRWIRQNGGSVDQRLAHRVVGTTFGARGIVATEYIPVNTLLLYLPNRLILHGNGSSEGEKLCNHMREADRQLRLGRDSFWYPYLDLDDSLSTRIPSLWDRNTLDLLQGLPPHIDATRHVHWAQKRCSFDPKVDALAKQAFLMLVSRSFGRGMIPWMDLLNHHNFKQNIRFGFDQTFMAVRASVDISAGDEIFISYGAGSTSDMFRYYGFIEPLPQVWSWIDDESKKKHSVAVLPNAYEGDSREDDDHNETSGRSGLIAIEPDDKVLAGIGNEFISLKEYKSRVQNHKSHLDGVVIAKFLRAARTLLVKKLPTTAREDERIINKLINKKVGERESGEDETTKLTDEINAIRYRIEFKRAIEQAIAVATEYLKDMQLAIEEDIVAATTDLRDIQDIPEF